MKFSKMRNDENYNEYAEIFMKITIIIIIVKKSWIVQI